MSLCYIRLLSTRDWFEGISGVALKFKEALLRAEVPFTLVIENKQELQEVDIDLILPLP